MENRGDGSTIVLDVDDPDEGYERAEERGADSVLEQRDVRWGRRIALIADPDGYLLEVSTSLGEE